MIIDINGHGFSCAEMAILTMEKWIFTSKHQFSLHISLSNLNIKHTIGKESSKKAVYEILNDKNGCKLVFSRKLLLKTILFFFGFDYYLIIYNQ